MKRLILVGVVVLFAFAGPVQATETTTITGTASKGQQGWFRYVFQTHRAGDISVTAQWTFKPGGRYALQLYHLPNCADHWSYDGSWGGEVYSSPVSITAVGAPQTATPGCYELLFFPFGNGGGTVKDLQVILVAETDA